MTGVGEGPRSHHMGVHVRLLGVFPVFHRTVDRIHIVALSFRDYGDVCLAIEGLLRGRGDRGARKIPPGISQGILRNFLREAALSGNRRGRFSLLDHRNRKLVVEICVEPGEKALLTLFTITFSDCT